MKLRVLLALCAASALPFAAHAAPKRTAPKKSAPKAARRTVLDYFKLLPARYFEIGDRRLLLQKAALPVIDLKNDYLQTSGDGGQAALQVAVFRYRGRDLVAVSASYAMDFDFALYRYQNRGWKNVTRALSPMANRSNLSFKLPRRGTTIKVFTESGQPLVQMVWEKGRFRGQSLVSNGRR